MPLWQLHVVGDQPRRIVAETGGNLLPHLADFVNDRITSFLRPCSKQELLGFGRIHGFGRRRNGGIWADTNSPKHDVDRASVGGLGRMIRSGMRCDQYWSELITSPPFFDPRA